MSTALDPLSLTSAAKRFWNFWSGEEKDRFLQLALEETGLKLNRWIPHVPTEKQASFLSLDELEAFYGGAAGGGKSDALLMAALQYVDVPGYAAILFRKSYSNLALPGALMDRASVWLGGTKAKWSADRKTWVFPSGATLSFGYLDSQHDRFRYQSSEFQYIGFDELTEFRETDYLYLFSRLRRLANSPVPLRMRAASNPGGRGHLWVKRRFVDDKSRPFVPARLDENPYLDREQYVSSLERLDPVSKARLLKGDWYVKREGLVYPEFDDCLTTEEPPEGTKIGGMDFGFHNPFCALWGVLDHDDVLWLTHCIYQRRIPVTDHATRLPGDVTWYADPAGADQRAVLRRLGHHVRPSPSRDIMAGVDLVNQRIRERRLRVVDSESMYPVKEEAGQYAYEEEKQSEKPLDENNHAMDALRYLVCGIDRKRGSHVPFEQEEDHEAQRLERAARRGIDIAGVYMGDEWLSEDNPEIWEGAGDD